MADREYRALVHEEDGAYWAEVQELPGCFASGRDLEELRDGIVEAITLYLEDGPPSATAKTSATTHVDEIRILVSS